MADLEVSAAVLARGLDLAFGVGPGEVLAVIGPNGAGKSTAMSVIAGVLPADRVFVRIGDRVLSDSAGQVDVAVHDRRIGLLSQEPLLFPHLSVLGNVLFAARRRSGGDPRARALHWLQRVGVADLADRRPAELSGGQAQRVALARALAAEPDALLLDEPLAGLDVAGAAAVRAVLREVLTDADRPTVLVTHDLLDVLGLADRVMVVEQGRIAEQGLVADVLAAPRSHFGARIAGVNLVRGVIAGPTVLSGAGQLWHGVPVEPLAVGSPAVAVFSPAAVSVYRDRPHGSPRNCVRVRIGGIELAAGAVRIRTADPEAGGLGLAADVTAEAVADLRLAVGQAVWLTVKAQAVGLHAGLRSESPELS